MCVLDAGGVVRKEAEIDVESLIEVDFTTSTA